MKDGVNEFVEKAKDVDGFVFGSPVYYAAASGSITSFLDRAFYSGGKHMAFKPGAVICSARRAGTT
ncbi:NAD(P)H-dependent oxidoreductase, partial [Vibrio cholerae O1]|nr:NAD(P)H-dependent oxidoreductase [Vibrio cholerae O1]